MADIQKVGVIGAGQMGSGIAHVFAIADYDIVLVDISPESLEKAKKGIEANLHRQAAKGVIEDSAVAAAIGKISLETELKSLSDCDLIIEAATEDQDTKIKIFKSVCEIAKEDVILASNTSSISITGLAAATNNPERFIGLHFMNPVPVMKLVEVIRGIATSQETFEVAKGIVARLGKTMAVSEDFPAFIVNRILMPMINEAI